MVPMDVESHGVPSHDGAGSSNYGSQDFSPKTRRTPKRVMSFRSGLDISFQDLTYHVASNKVKGERAHLLSQCCGFFKSNQLSALMGASGSGKTTLLDVLAGRKTQGVIEGKILFGGQEPSHPFLCRYTGYVEQFDTLIGTMTVREMLSYTADLKRPLTESAESKKEAVDKLISKLGLEACADILVGDPLTKGISGGQAKRTNIGIALITEPRVLFLDEPTSGLDSFTSNEVMSVVQQLALEGTTVCATIHSPSAYCFNLFHSVMLLLSGEVAYFGPGGPRASGFALDHFPTTGAVLHANAMGDLTDAEYLVQAITLAQRDGDATAITSKYANSRLKADNDHELMRLVGNQGTIPESVTAELKVRKATTTPWWYQIWTLLKYRGRKNYSNPDWVAPRVADKLVFSFIVVTLYLGIGDNLDQANIVNQQSLLFMWCVLPAFGAASYVPAIVMERRLFIRERADGLYAVASYLLAKLIEELILAAFVSVIASAVVFYGVKLQGSFGIFWIVYYITLCNGIVLAYLVASISPNMDVANAALPTYVVTLLFFAGLLMTHDTMPPWWKWFSYIDFLKYSWGALMVNQFRDNDITYTSDGVSILNYFSLAGVSTSAFIGFDSIFFFVYAMLAFLALTFIRWDKR